jgi:hypothetical protein
MDSNSYVKNLRVLVFQMDGRNDGQSDGERPTPAALGMEELFPAVLERFLQPMCSRFS